MAVTTGADPTTDRRRAIHAAAIEQFSLRGVAATSMADIAAAAGMSRPALYQYFDNKLDVFTSAFTALLDDHVERALAALAAPGSTAERIDGLLQRFDGDLWELLAASPHSEEIVASKNAQLAASVAAIVGRLRVGVAAFLVEVAPGRSRAAIEQRAAWAEVLELAPKGFKADRPAVDVYRRRLATLAAGVAADIGMR